ncbi:unnamed protein product [Prunus armeniaca]|uniref:Uncharacterized protein n=1 Tax=Prunus armeniaca TaxID=36596 RepID=A0A6J5XMG8_PRUAR|nr:unnamed protein product [Prunus armeniaca]CAB4312308.1 unnamed protein product [Prunus armeniaca]
MGSQELASFPTCTCHLGLDQECLGQNLAMVELKVLIALIVSNFSFSLSPKYNHGPALRLVVEPEHGVDLLVRKL